MNQAKHKKTNGVKMYDFIVREKYGAFWRMANYICIPHLKGQ
jgi:hypothetical protein